MMQPSPFRRRNAPLSIALLGALALALGSAGCGHATRKAATPQKSQTTTTAGALAKRVERLVVGDPSVTAMVSRDGCVATITSAEMETGSSDELRVRCPKPERLESWFAGAEKYLAGFSYEAAKEDDDDPGVPAAKVLTTSGDVLRLTRPADVQKLLGEVKAFATELAKAEQPAPGPASSEGWQMLRVTGPAHVLFAGTPARGFFEARISTTGQYMCEFIARMGDGPMRATKSGWLAPATATRVIDEVMVPFDAAKSGDRSKQAYAAGTKAGAEHRSSELTTGAVFDRFAHMQDALGDACLPELETPAAPQIGL